MTADIHFSPLALTHALPFLPLAQGDIDYQVDRRSEPGLIDELLAEPTTKSRAYARRTCRRTARPRRACGL